MRPLDLRNPQAGAATTHRAFSPEDLREIRESAKSWGKIVAHRACGDGPLTEVDLNALEQLGQADAAGLTERTLACRDGTLTQSEPVGPCPDCRRYYEPGSRPCTAW